MSDSILSRASRAAQFLSVESSVVMGVLHKVGIEDNDVGLIVIGSSSITVEDLIKVLTEIPGMEAKLFPVKMAADILKMGDGLSQKFSATNVAQSTSIESLGAFLKPISQWDDRYLLENFAANRSSESEEELDRRAKRQRFVVFKDPSIFNIKKYEPGKESIDIEKSLELLKVARKRTTPGVIPNGNLFSMVYRITELNMNDRVVELCPICGATLYQGYCDTCQEAFAGIDDDSRAFMTMVTKIPDGPRSSMFRASSFSDRKALVASARKGIDDLKMTWPSLVQKFDEAKLTNTLPSLRVISNRPSTAVADPYHVDGCRITGNRSF